MKDKISSKEKMKKDNRLFKFLFDSPYGVCAAGMLLLIVLAFFGPQLVFGIQDKYQSDRVWQGARNSLDMEALYQSYDGLRDRLISFADIRNNFEIDVAGTDYKINTDFYDMMDMILATDYLYAMAEFAGVFDVGALETRRYTANKWKKYILYCDEYDEDSATVLISAWYAQLQMRDGATIELLIDTETYEIYYIRVDDYRDERIKITRNKYFTYILSGMEEVIFCYWFDYYKAGENSSQSFLEYMADPTYTEEAGIDQIYVRGEGYADERFGITEYSMYLPYWDNFLKCELLYCDYYDMHESFRISMGLPQIAEWIPEFQEN